MKKTRGDRGHLLAKDLEASDETHTTASRSPDSQPREWGGEGREGTVVQAPRVQYGLTQFSPSLSLRTPWEQPGVPHLCRAPGRGLGNTVRRRPPGTRPGGEQGCA